MELAARVDRLEEALSQLAAAQRDLAASQARTERHVEALAAMQRELVAAQERTEGRLAALAAAQERTEAQVRTLAAAQERTEAQVRTLADGLHTLAAAQERTESRLAALAAAQERTEAQLGTLLSWQKGEDGRRRGEYLERDVARGAPVLFAGGDGGPPDQPAVRRWLLARLLPLMQGGAGELWTVENPFYADLIWWKGDVAAVVEVSAVVDEDDVERARQRAETLRRAGIEAIPTVIGDSWASGQDRYLADIHHLAYKVGHEVSDAYIAFRRLPAPVLDPSS
jgi:hypothetical protein